MNVLLLTTCICSDDNIKDLKRLINSVNRVNAVNFEHIVLLQKSSEYSEGELQLLATQYNLRTLKVDNMISLSKARNILIDEAKKLDLFPKSDFVTFPDDDCWYPDTFWENFIALEKQEKFEFFYTEFSSAPLETIKDNNEHTTSNVIRHASSNTCFYKVNLFNQIGSFDEGFGVGAKNNGGEDLDCAIRALLLSQNTYFLNLPLIGHRDALPEFRYKYFQGSFGILNRYKFKNTSLFINFCRKFAIGIIFYLQGKIKLAHFKTVA